MTYEELREQIMKDGRTEVHYYGNGASMQAYAKAWQKKFKLSGFFSTLYLFCKNTYPPNFFPAVSALLDSYSPAMVANMIIFCLAPQLRGNIMMFLEELRLVFKANKQLDDEHAWEKIELASGIIARCLCLMPSEKIARITFKGVLDPDMQKLIKEKLFSLDQEVAERLTA